ncbi:MAG: DNA polymerase subunit beta [Chlorobi bacterium]|nr:DNA polymerase subunit beta [Chlorobiota bacterium]
MLFDELISKKKDDLMALLYKHHVDSMYAFGSVVTEKFDPERSDIDLIVEIEEDDPVEKGEHLLSLWDELEKFFNRKVDLLTQSSIKNPYLRKSIEATKIKIYDRRKKKILV